MTRTIIGLLVLVGACGPRPEHPEVARQLLRAADQNGDGAISSEEFTALSLPRQGFAPHDTDHDGQLDAVELERAFLSTSPTDFQDEGRRAVHHKYGHPFGGGPGGRKGKRPPGAEAAPPGAPR